MEVSIKLSEYGKKLGITYRTAHEWYKHGKIPNSYMTPSGSIFVKEIVETIQLPERVVVYCRVSNQSRKDELEYQVNRCTDFCASRGYIVSGIYKEVASGMNDTRKQLWKMLESNPSLIVIENKDRLTRFGYTYLERLLKDKGCEIILMNPAVNDEQDLIKDLVSVITSFCCRLYGLRRTKNKVAKIKELVYG